jgi:hypothetical protein
MAGAGARRRTNDKRETDNLGRPLRATRRLSGRVVLMDSTALRLAARREYIACAAPEQLEGQQRHAQNRQSAAKPRNVQHE